MKDAHDINRDDDNGDFFLGLILWLTALLGACGDNLERPTLIEPGGAQPPATFVISKGTFAPAVDGTVLFPTGRLSWTLSPDGEVYLPLSVRRLDEIHAIQIDGNIGEGSEPIYTVIDQVGPDLDDLDVTQESTLGKHGRARLALDVPLIIGSRGEFVTVRVTATGAPVQIFSLDWSSQ